MTIKDFDVIIVGAGAAGLFCATHAAWNGLTVCLLDHSQRIGNKILVSGGGKCNFTNISVTPDQYVSANPGFCISALKRFSSDQFIRWVEEQGVDYFEKERGQLFCRQGSRALLEVLLREAEEAGVELLKGKRVLEVKKSGSKFKLNCEDIMLKGSALVVATGGLSLPKSGASSFAFEMAKKFSIGTVEPRPGLVPLLLPEEWMCDLRELAGVSFDAEVNVGRTRFSHRVLITHRGLSGPAILQISSYWKAGEQLVLNLLPGLERGVLFSPEHRDMSCKRALGRVLPNRLSEFLCHRYQWHEHVKSMSRNKMVEVEETLRNWKLIPVGTEGYRSAEVTCGGVDTRNVSSKTFESKEEGLYFIGECLDVTGHLGGYNFQWAWSSGWCCAQALGERFRGS